MTYRCYLCEQRFDRLWNLNRHLENCHQSKPVLHDINQDGSSSVDEETEGLISARSESQEQKHLQSEDVKEEGMDSTLEDEDEEEDGCTDDDYEGHTESEVEDSEEWSDTEDEETLLMKADNEREIRIWWPINPLYKIPYLWSYWGNIPRIKKHILWLERLRDLENPTVIYNIENGSESQIAALCEIAFNLVHGHMPVERYIFMDLRKHRRGVRFLALPDLEIRVKREELLRRGANFVQLLLHTINPLILYNIPRTMDNSFSDMSEETCDLETDDSQYGGVEDEKENGTDRETKL